MGGRDGGIDSWQRGRKRRGGEVIRAEVNRRGQNDRGGDMEKGGERAKGDSGRWKQGWGQGPRREGEQSLFSPCCHTMIHISTSKSADFSGARHTFIIN